MIRNTATRWGALSQFLHWGIGALILFLLLHGWWMTEFSAREARFEHYTWHASVGYVLLPLMILRLAWRWLNEVPELARASAAWERISARFAHCALYVLIFVATVSGWALAGTSRRPLDTVFGWVRVPAIVSAPDRRLHEQLEHLHSFLAWTLVVLLIVHVAGALYHLIIKKDDVVQRMLHFGAGQNS